MRPEGTCCLTCSHALEAFCGPDDPPKDQLIKLWKSKDPEWVHNIKIAVLAARAVVLKSLRHEEVIQEEQIKLSLQFRCRFVTDLVFKKQISCNAEESAMTVFELPGFSGKPLSGVIFKITEPWPTDVRISTAWWSLHRAADNTLSFCPVIAPSRLSMQAKGSSWWSTISQKTE